MLRFNTFKYKPMGIQIHACKLLKQSKGTKGSTLLTYQPDTQKKSKFLMQQYSTKSLNIPTTFAAQKLLMEHFDTDRVWQVAGLQETLIFEKLDQKMKTLASCLEYYAVKYNDVKERQQMIFNASGDKKDETSKNKRITESVSGSDADKDDDPFKPTKSEDELRREETLRRREYRRFIKETCYESDWPSDFDYETTDDDSDWDES